jgi:magnesium transporter
MRKPDPSSMQFVGEQYLEEPSTQLFIYNEAGYEEIKDQKIDQMVAFNDPEKVYWLNIHGIHDTEMVKTIGHHLGIHNFVIQDILDTTQRSKVQELEDYMFFSIRSILPTDHSDISMEQISFILGKNYLVSFQERINDYFDHVRYRIREYKGFSRERGPDFLLYLLIESILDNYFTTIEVLDDKIMELTDFSDQKRGDPSQLQHIEFSKQTLTKIKKSISPLRDALHQTDRMFKGFIEPTHLKYYIDLREQCYQLVEMIDSQYAILESGINMYFSLQGHLMNQVMKTLTIIATIFIPLTFIAGIYGMNFSHMPELHWKWGYYAILILMLIITLLMVIYFKRKKWF